MPSPTPPARCPFCTAIDPAVTILEDARVRVIVSLSPINGWHALVIPRLHVERFTDLSAENMAAVMAATQRVARALSATARPDGITYVTEDDLTGQGYNLVRHWKLHVIARFKDDAVRLEWGRTPDPGDVARAEIAAKLREACAIG